MGGASRAFDDLFETLIERFFPEWENIYYLLALWLPEAACTGRNHFAHYEAPSGESVKRYG